MNFEIKLSHNKRLMFIKNMYIVKNMFDSNKYELHSLSLKHFKY